MLFRSVCGGQVWHVESFPAGADELGVMVGVVIGVQKIHDAFSFCEYSPVWILENHMQVWRKSSWEKTKSPSRNREGSLSKKSGAGFEPASQGDP